MVRGRLQGHLADRCPSVVVVGAGQRKIEHVSQTRNERSICAKRTVRACRIEAEQDLVELRYAPICREITQIQAQDPLSSAYRADVIFLQRITLYSG